MQTIQPWMRMKLNSDTIFLPAEDGSVYFRNNSNSFRLKGTSMLSWVEQLLPALNGQQSMEELTDGLPEAYRSRIYEITSILYNNGYLRDTSTDKPHGLSPAQIEAYKSQIEFLDTLGGSGAHRFEVYRNSHVLIIGRGELALRAASALLESGLAEVHVVDNVENHSSTAPPPKEAEPSLRAQNVAIQMHDMQQALQTVVHTMDAVLCLCDKVCLDTLRRVEVRCREANIPLFSAITIGQVGLVIPPAVDEASQTLVSFDSVWRRVHSSVWEKNHTISGFTDIARDVLMNVLGFEFFRFRTGVESENTPRVYKLDGETLEGDWHKVIPTQPLTSDVRFQTFESLRDEMLDNDAQQTSIGHALEHFFTMTNPITGIFHVWDEGNLEQVPLAQCRVQAIDPLSLGPATLMQAFVAASLTHDDARYEAGLMGIETYAHRLAFQGSAQIQDVSIGAGRTLAEAIGRGLRRALTRELKRTVQQTSVSVHRIHLNPLDDELAQFCLEALQATGHQIAIWRGEDVVGFPVLWVEAHASFIGSIGFNLSMALQQGLLQALALLCEHDGSNGVAHDSLVVVMPNAQMRTDVHVDVDPVHPLTLPRWDGFQADEVLAALDVLLRQGVNVQVKPVPIEAFLRDITPEVVSVTIVLEEST